VADRRSVHNQTGTPGDGAFLFDSRAARDPRLSDQAKGRLVHLWCIADDRGEVFASIRDMAAESGNGITAVTSAVAELIDAGYLERFTVRNGGRVAGGGYRIVPGGGAA
jgi:hypothetical protein